MRNVVSLVVGLLVASGQPIWATPYSSGWMPFGNARFGTIAEVPSKIFKAQPPPGNGDGRTFLTKDGAELRISGGYGPLSVTDDGFRGYKKWFLDNLRQDGIRIIYKDEGKNWLAYSGLKGTDVIYYKMIEGCGSTHTVYASYPRSLKGTYDPIVARVSGALRCHTPTWECPKGEGYCTASVRMRP